VLGLAGIIHVSNIDVIAVSSTAGSILFFNLRDYHDLGRTLEEDDAVQVSVPLGLGWPQQLVLGELSNEILFTTDHDNGVVYRACVPNTGCKPSIRETVMVLSTDRLEGIAVVRENDSYLVAASAKDRVYECPLAQPNTLLEHCGVFSDRPEGAYVNWFPMGLLVDETKSLVYVADRQCVRERSEPCPKYKSRPTTQP
jgi:hypothetical protein